jgi:hypothetical protein
MVALQIASAVQQFSHMQPGQEEDAPVIHVKSGTTNLEISIHVRQDAKK